MLSADYDNLLRKLWLVRLGRSRTDVSFDVGQVLGYLDCLWCHGLVDVEGYKRLKNLLGSAQEQAMFVVFDLEAQGWA